MNQWFANLGSRERLLVILASTLLLLLVLYGVVWRPVDQRVERLQETVTEQRSLRHWMQKAAREVEQLRGAAGGAAVRHGSLLSITDRTANQAGLGGAVKRVEPEGSGKVRIQLEGAGFDDIANWLEGLAREFDIRVESITVDGSQGPGLVDARLTLEVAS